MTYDTRFAWSVVTGGKLLSHGDEIEAWSSLIEHAESYPAVKFAPPLQASKRREQAKRIAGLVWEYSGPEVRTSRITAVTASVDGSETRIEMSGDDDANAGNLEELLLLPAAAGCMFSAWAAADAGFGVFLAQLARPLVRRGLTLEPIATGTRCKAIILRRGRRVIWLTDAQEMIGGATLTEANFEAEYAPRTIAPIGSATRLAAALNGFQGQLEAMFGVALHATIGGAALRAASGYIDRKRAVWRPSPLLVEMLRAGRGYRGGYTAAARYDGPAYRADINKAYTAALATRLPLRSALSPASPDNEGKPGVFLCRITGPGMMPIYVAPWSRQSKSFEMDYWNGRECHAILASAEIAGIRALGYEVDQRGGFVFVRDWTLAPFSRRIAELCAQHGRGSAHERTAKIIGNSVYGKLAERPERDEVMYADHRPGPDWHPMIDARGDEVADLWTQRTVTHRPGQHVDVAAHATATVRGWLYEAMAIAIRLGGDVVHADTDGLITTNDIADYLVTDESQPGAWRAERDPRRAIVWGRKGYAFGDEVRTAGVSGISVQEAAQIAAGGAVETYYTETPAPWKSSAGVQRRIRTARATA